MASAPRLSARPKAPETPPAQAADAPRGKVADTPRGMTDAQRDYERKRAQKAGMSLDKWLNQKQKQAEVAAPKPAKPPRKPGLLSRLLDRAHEPLKKKR